MKHTFYKQQEQTIENTSREQWLQYNPSSLNKESTVFMYKLSLAEKMKHLPLGETK